MSTPDEHRFIKYCLENELCTTSQITIPIEWLIRENAAPDDLTWEPETLDKPDRKIIDPEEIIEELLREEMMQPQFALGEAPF